jgi:rhodanese-related sulfurtransferase
MSVSASEAEEMMAANRTNPHFKVIDVRTTLERWISHIPNSEHVPLMDL